MNNEYNKEWDILVNDLLDNHEFTELGSHTVTLGGVKIWIANRPYSSVIPYSYDILAIRPSRLTILRFFNKLDSHIMGQVKKDIVK